MPAFTLLFLTFSMHLNENPKSLSTFFEAVMMARAVVDLADKIGFNVTLLDIGGDCVGRFTSEFCFEEVIIYLDM